MTVLCFFPNKWQKMNTVSQTESRTLLQHHSLKKKKKQYYFASGMDKGSVEQARKLSSVLEFVTRQRLQPHFSVILLVARIFPRPCGARKNTTQLVKYPRVLSVKPSNEVYLFY